MPKSKRTTKAFICSEYISLSDRYGEIAYWDAREWKEDPSITPKIAFAIRMLYERGPEAVRKLLKENT
jgi:hypothetical protein